MMDIPPAPDESASPLNPSETKTSANGHVAPATLSNWYSWCKKWCLRGCIAVVLGVFSLPFILAGIANMLISSDIPTHASVAVPFGGEEAYRKVQSLLNEQMADYAGVVDFAPGRLVQRGLAPPHHQNMLAMYEKQNIPPEKIWTAPQQAQSFSNLLKLLGDHIENQSLDSVIIVCNVYRSRWMKSKLYRQLPQEQADRILIVTVDPYEFTIWNWWRSSHGRRTIITESLDYLAYCLAEHQGNEKCHIRSPEELRNATIGAQNDGPSP